MSCVASCIAEGATDALCTLLCSDASKYCNPLSDSGASSLAVCDGLIDEVIFWWSWPLIVLLVCLSGLFSGLTLGLLGLDVNGLDIEISGGGKEAEYATKILPIRSKGNFLLCTLLLGNVAVNSALAILMGGIAGGTLGFLVSTFSIVIFGEIIPQASCSRHALYIGAKTLWLVKAFMVLMAPIAWPISRVLDWALGDELGTIYDNAELKRLLQLHALSSDVELKDNQARIMAGAIDFADKEVGDVMTAWEEVFMVGTDELLSFDVLSKIFKMGHSRIPVFDAFDERHQIVGLLFVKDLILVDPEDEIPVSTLLQLYGRETQHVFPDYPLDRMLSDFLKGRSHLAIVRDVNAQGEGDPFYFNVGLVTMEDIIEEILQTEIVDETDVYVEMSRKEAVRNRRQIDLSKLSLFDPRHRLPESSLTPAEADAVFHHLVGTLALFRYPRRTMDDSQLKHLIECAEVIEVLVADGPLGSRPRALSTDELKSGVQRGWNPEHDIADEGGLSLYSRGQPSDYFTLVLDGRVQITAGEQGFKSELARWQTLCCDSLEPIEQETDLDNIDPFVPDFSAHVLKTSRILRISRKAYWQVLNNCLTRKPSSRTILTSVLHKERGGLHRFPSAVNPPNGSQLHTRFQSMPVVQAPKGIRNRGSTSSSSNQSNRIELVPTSSEAVRVSRSESVDTVKNEDADGDANATAASNDAIVLDVKP